MARVPCVVVPERLKVKLSSRLVDDFEESDSGYIAATDIGVDQEGHVIVRGAAALWADPSYVEGPSVCLFQTVSGLEAELPEGFRFQRLDPRVLPVFDRFVTPVIGVGLQEREGGGRNRAQR